MWTSSDPSCRARHAENAEILRVLPQELIELESHRASNRWDGYQFMSPLECTRQFAADYRKQFAATFYGECYFDPEVGSPEFETLWRMRLAADACSYMSYRMYLAISFHLVRRKDPEPFRQPHLLFERRQEKPSWNKQAKREMAESWSWDLSKVADMGHYQRFSYVGLPAQLDFRTGIKRAAKANGWRRSAEKYVFQSPVLSPADLVSDLAGTERAAAIAEIKAIRDPIIRVADKVEPHNLIQSCFAWPRTRFQASRCSVCPQEEACAVGLAKP